MKLKALQTLAIVLLVPVALTLSSMALGQEIQWHTYHDGMARGKFENKRVFIHFWAEWCAACKTMEKNTFSDPDVIAALNENFIPVKVNADREVTTAGMYRVQALPDNWFIATDGEIIGNRPGYIPPDLLKNILKIILSDSQADQ